MSKPAALNLLPAPRSLKRLMGHFTLPKNTLSAVKVVRTDFAPAHPEGYALTIDKGGITIEFRESAGLRAATATLRQLLREHNRRLSEPRSPPQRWPRYRGSRRWNAVLHRYIEDRSMPCGATHDPSVTDAGEGK